MVGTTQATLLSHGNAVQPSFEGLSGLREHLRAENGLRWRYRQPWFLLTGDDATIEQLLPDFVDHGWVATQEAVLLWSKTDKDGQTSGWQSTHAGAPCSSILRLSKR
jgi:type VI secretion system protein ImpL